MGFRQLVKKVPVWGRILIVALIVVAVGIIGLNIYLTNLVNKRLRQMVTESSHGLYKLDYSRVSVNVLTSSLTLRNVSLNPDSNAIAQLRPRFLAGGKTKKLSLRNVHWLSYLSNKNLSIGKVLIEGPEFNITQYNRPDTTTKSLPKQIKDLRIGVFSMSDAVINYQIADTTAKARTVNRIEHLNIGFTEIHFDKEDKLAADDYTIQLKEYRHRSADSLYWLGIRGLDYNSNQGKLKLNSFFVEPRYSDKEFGKKVNTQEVIYKINLEDIAAEGFDMSRFVEKGEAIVPQMQIGKGTAEIYLDRALPRPTHDQVDVSISQKLLHLGVPVMVQKLDLDKIDVKYREQQIITKREAEIVFSQLSGQATNITNIPGYIAKDRLMKTTLNCTFLGSAVNARFEFDLSRPDGSFSTWVKADQLEADRLNPVLAAVAKIEARRGTLHLLESTIHGNQDGATANVNFKYAGLKIDVLKSDGDSLIKKGLPSVFANVMIFDDNPKDGTLRTANGVSVRRGFARSFFNMLWLSVSTGIQQILVKKKGLKLG